MKLLCMLSIFFGLMVANELRAQTDLPKAQALFAAARKASGFEAKGPAIKSVACKGKLKAPPAESIYEFELIQSINGKGNLKFTAQGLDVEVVFDGTQGWSAMGNEKQPQPSMDAYLMMLLLIPNGMEQLNYFDSIETIGKATWENVPCYEVECRKGEKLEIYCYFSVDTGLEMGRTAEGPTPNGLQEVQIAFEDYREAEGIKIPYKRIVRMPDRQEMEVSSITFSDSIDERLFQRVK